jgi:hypothetical protein
MEVSAAKENYTAADMQNSLHVPQSDFLIAGPEVPGSIPGATRFSEKQWVWNGVHSALVRINEELLERKVAAPV